MEETNVKTKINTADIRLVIPVFLLNKLKQHPLTQGLYPISLGQSSQNSGYQINQQKMNHHCLVYCQTGEIILNDNGRSLRIKRGDIALKSPSQSLQINTQDNQNHDYYWINFTGNLALDFAQRLLMKMDNDIAHVGDLTNIFNDFDELLALGQKGYTATNVIHAVHVLQQALSFLALQLRLNVFNKSSKFDLEAIENLMRNNLHHELNLDTLAHYSQLSKYHFCKKFKELTDSTPIQHFINMKMQKACFLLDNTTDAIKKVAEALGYSDPYYFSRLFKKTVGMSPKQYRGSHQSTL